MFPSRKWLYPGMHVKRWIVLLMVGFMAFALACAMFLAWIYRTIAVPEPFTDPVQALTLQFIPHPFREVLVGTFGLTLTVMAICKFYSSLMEVVSEPRKRERLVDLVYARRLLKTGPKIVTIGGGTGQAVLLRGLKEYTNNLTAIVTVVDDGGSSGRLRREFGALPPGDVRQCIGALAIAEPLMTRLLNYRFSKGDGLEGHSLGNLMMLAMADLTGNFESGIRELSRVLAVRGQVLPSTLESVKLCAELEDGRVISGESAVGEADSAIKRVYLDRQHPTAFSEACQAISEADYIILAPGSLYTSLLPNLLVPEISQAVANSKALKLYVCNVATEPGETSHYGVEEHLAALKLHAPSEIFKVALVNDRTSLPFANGSYELIELSKDKSTIDGLPIATADVIDVDKPSQHDPVKLAQAVMQVYSDYGMSKRDRKRAESEKMKVS
jgi:uncharacterized cofD-like protein